LKNPSGKLPITFPYAGKGFLDAIVPSQFPGVPSDDRKTQTVSYSEQLHIGYRWYVANISGRCAPVNGRNPCVAFPFGHGLSYTRFSIGKARLAIDTSSGIYRVTTNIRNTGKRSGAEIVQVYLSLPASASDLGVTQPPKRLVGFQKIELAPEASQELTVAIDPAASNHPLAVWSQDDKKWVMPQGKFTIWLGRSSSPHDLVLVGTFKR
jgi:beta-glucosidase